MRCGPFSVRFYQATHGPLGGDWSAVRELPNQTLVIAVGDVTGKGIAAAMVVQAVQALWALALKQPIFEPALWLQSVNDTLYMMGEREPHTMTLGLMVVERQKLTYYSAGHVPAVVRTPAKVHEEARIIQATGVMLGLYESCALSAAEFRLDSDVAQSILIGSDGIFGWDIRRNKKIF